MTCTTNSPEGITLWPHDIKLFERHLMDLPGGDSCGNSSFFGYQCSQFPSPISTQPAFLRNFWSFHFLRHLTFAFPILVPIQYGFPWQSAHLQVSPPHKGWRSSILQISASMDSSINDSSSTKKWPIFWNPHPVACRKSSCLANFGHLQYQ